MPWRLAVLLPAGAAQADVGESIPSYAAVVTLDKDGTMHVQETISYVFGGTSHHGIYRELRPCSPMTRVRLPDSRIRRTGRATPARSGSTRCPTSR